MKSAFLTAVASANDPVAPREGQVVTATWARGDLQYSYAPIQSKQHKLPSVTFFFHYLVSFVYKGGLRNIMEGRRSIKLEKSADILCHWLFRYWQGQFQW